MTKFTKEFIEAQLTLTDGQRSMQLRIISNDPFAIEYAESAVENYAAALAEIQRLQEKLDAANARIAEFEVQWHPCSEPPSDNWWVLVEVVDKLGIHDITPGWYEAKQGHWNIEYAGWYDILRWRELPRGGKNELE